MGKREIRNKISGRKRVDEDSKSGDNLRVG